MKKLWTDYWRVKRLFHCTTVTHVRSNLLDCRCGNTKWGLVCSDHGNAKKRVPDVWSTRYKYGILTGWRIKYLQWRLQSGWSGKHRVMFNLNISFFGSVCCHWAERSSANQLASLTSSFIAEVLKPFYVWFLLFMLCNLFCSFKDEPQLVLYFSLFLSTHGHKLEDLLFLWSAAQAKLKWGGGGKAVDFIEWAVSSADLPQTHNRSTLHQSVK